MKNLPLIEWIVVIFISIVLAILILLFVWFMNVNGESEFPQAWLDWATCDGASMYTLDIPGGQTSYFEVISPGDRGAWYLGDFAGCLANKCWYGRFWDEFIDEREWYVHGEINYNGVNYRTNGLYIDCRNKTYLPVIMK